MNCKKALIVLTASLALGSICPAITNSQKVEAKTHYKGDKFIRPIALFFD